MMTVVTINARVNTWSAEISSVVSDQPFERHFAAEGNIHRGTRFALGAQLTGLMVSISCRSDADCAVRVGAQGSAGRMNSDP